MKRFINRSAGAYFLTHLVYVIVTLRLSAADSGVAQSYLTLLVMMAKNFFGISSRVLSEHAESALGSHVTTGAATTPNS